MGPVTFMPACVFLFSPRIKQCHLRTERSASRPHPKLLGGNVTFRKGESNILSEVAIGNLKSIALNILVDERKRSPRQTALSGAQAGLHTRAGIGMVGRTNRLVKLYRLIPGRRLGLPSKFSNRCAVSGDEPTNQRGLSGRLTRHKTPVHGITPARGQIEDNSIFMAENK
ncbi:hypothetical protein Pst134EB_014264 [Puccinia striiformis f. sp. tritici]|nr:hypothetical protein Pst134EB_014264 [Puccinia striiformis f. sp. tritici]